jgi:hypothetical protein
MEYKITIQDMAIPKAEMPKFILNQSQDAKNYSNPKLEC